MKERGAIGEIIPEKATNFDGNKRISIRNQRETSRFSERIFSVVKGLQLFL